MLCWRWRGPRGDKKRGRLEVDEGRWKCQTCCKRWSCTVPGGTVFIGESIEKDVFVFIFLFPFLSFSYRVESDFAVGIVAHLVVLVQDSGI
jgi:hypothetical protein